jgi:hypothetical protein
VSEYYKATQLEELADLCFWKLVGIIAWLQMSWFAIQVIGIKLGILFATAAGLLKRRLLLMWASINES